MPRSILQILLSSCILLAVTGNAVAQPSNPGLAESDSLSWYIRMKYGLDQELINGFQFYRRYVKYKGDPYFPADSFYRGSVYLKGNGYDGVQLKYDSYSQQLILGYTDFKNQYNQLIINSIHVDSFSLGIHRFKQMALPGRDILFYQVLEAGPVTCYIHWRRDIHVTHDDMQYSHEYTGPIGTYYIRYNGRVRPFNNKRSLVHLFPESLQPAIKRYIRQQRIRLREAGPGETQHLINFIGSHIEPPPLQ